MTSCLYRSSRALYILVHARQDAPPCRLQWTSMGKYKIISVVGLQTVFDGSRSEGCSSMVEDRKSSVCSWSYHTAICMRSATFQAGDKDTELPSKLVSESSFLSVSASFFCRRGQCSAVHLSLLEPSPSAVDRTHRPGFQVGSGGRALWGFGNVYIGKHQPTAQQVIKQCEAQSVWHHGWTWHPSSYNRALSEDSAPISTCSSWLVQAVGRDVWDRSKTSEEGQR